MINKKALITSTTIFVALGVAVVFILMNAARTYESNATYQNMLISNNVAYLLTEIYNVPGDVDFKYSDTFLGRKEISIDYYRVLVRNNDSSFHKDAIFFGLREPEVSSDFKNNRERYFVKRGNDVQSYSKSIYDSLDSGLVRTCPTVATQKQVSSVTVSFLSEEVDEELASFSQSLADLLDENYDAKFEEEIKTKPSLLIVFQKSQKKEIYTNFLDQESLKLSCILEKKLDLDPEPIDKLKNKNLFNKADIVLLILLDEESLQNHALTKQNILEVINDFNE